MKKVLQDIFILFNVIHAFGPNINPDFFAVLGATQLTKVATVGTTEVAGDFHSMAEW